MRDLKTDMDREFNKTKELIFIDLNKWIHKCNVDILDKYVTDPDPGLRLPGQIEPILRVNKRVKIIDKDGATSRLFDECELKTALKLGANSFIETKGIRLKTEAVNRFINSSFKGFTEDKLKAYYFIIFAVQVYLQHILVGRKFKSHFNKIVKEQDLFTEKFEALDIFPEDLLDFSPDLDDLYILIMGFVKNDAWCRYVLTLTGTNLVIKKKGDLRVHEWYLSQLDKNEDD